jgi:hypothetical protein
MKWTHEIEHYSPAEVQEFCVNDSAWQKFRLSLKGKPTHEKLEQLQYWRRQHLFCAEHEVLPRRHQVQIDNYLNALKRGGQLSVDGVVVR